MKKLVLRLLALVLVLCMVVPCMPVGALAVDLTRPENISDAEWEVLRQQLLAQLAADQAAATPPVTEETLPEIFEVMVTHDKMNLTVQAIQHLRPFGGATQAKITQVEHRILRTNNLVPITNEYLIHFLHIPEGTITKPDNVRMMKMRIRGEKQMIRV